jgi:putative serine protease PepD
MVLHTPACLRPDPEPQTERPPPPPPAFTWPHLRRAQLLPRRCERHGSPGEGGGGVHLGLRVGPHQAAQAHNKRGGEGRRLGNGGGEAAGSGRAGGEQQGGGWCGRGSTGGRASLQVPGWGGGRPDGCGWEAAPSPP